MPVGISLCDGDNFALTGSRECGWKKGLDRLNPLYPSDYKFRKVYMMSVAAEDDPHVPDRAVHGLRGWIECFEKASFAGSLFCGGINDPGEAAGRTDAQERAYAFGRSLC